MPEGDTVHKLAVYLDGALRGRRVQAVELSPRLGPSAGPGVITRIESLGKHLYIHFAQNIALRSHLGMYGSWHRYDLGAAWRRPVRQASIILRTETADYVCFNAKEVQWLDSTGFVHADQTQRLGPDLIRQAFDGPCILLRVRALFSRNALLVDVLLDQRVAAGIGNVYKSEVLFLGRIAPSARIGDVPDGPLVGLYREAAMLLARNLGGGPRVTRDRPRSVRDSERGAHLWVYGRSGLPCLRCGAAVQRAMLGARPRSTYWCPGCQPIVME